MGVRLFNHVKTIKNNLFKVVDICINTLYNGKYSTEQTLTSMNERGEGKVTRKQLAHSEDEERMYTMREAMDYLTRKGFPCQSRNTFYKMLDNFNIPFTDINTGGKNAIRRFPLSGLKKFLREQGLEA